MKLPVNYNELDYKEKPKVRQAYIELQKGLCYYCGTPLISEPASKINKLSINKTLFPENFFKYPIHLHHSHDTGLTIGAVHCKCNSVLWQYYGE